jgi:uncharacterized LabA/DUF88 family protein
MNKMKKIAILIDGSNFYFKLKDIGLQNQLAFDFSSFCKFLANKNQIVFQKYYIGKVRTDGTTKLNKLHANQQKLFQHLLKHNIKYELGYLLKSNDKFHEKGVDVHMAVDILVNSYEKIADKIIIISSDTDLLPAIIKAKQLKKHVEYIGFSHQPGVAMVANCTSSRLLTKSELEKFVVSV